MTSNKMTDLQLKAQKAILDDDRTKEHGIQVLDENGVITLEGKVPSRDVKETAQSIVEEALDIKSIINRLDIKKVEGLDEVFKEKAISG
jgi:osmotically-inducible protein OsmY